MNLHVPQTEESRTEALELMSTKKNMVTPRNGEPIIAAIQDFITAAYLLSRKDKFYDRQQFCQICSFLADANLQVDLPPPTVWKPVRLWTGKQVFNVLMKPTRDSPINVNLEAKCRTLEAPAKGSGFPLDMSPNDGYLVIRNSEIMCGVMDKATVGDGKKNSVFGVILRDYGSDEAAIAMNRLAKLCARWLANVGFSLGINDVIPGPLLLAQKTELIQQSYDVCADLIDQAKRGVLKNAPGSDQAGTLEMKLSGELSGVRAACGELCMAELSRHNAPATMATCGSKGARPAVPSAPLRPLTPFACLSLAGSKLNVAQMVAVVGQQIIAGSRVVDGFQDRFLPHFRKKAREPPAKGFVANSFFSGLSPTEFLAHAMSGREGLVDTAVKTAETGYMARRLMKVGRYLAGGSLPTDLWVSLTSSLLLLVRHSRTSRPATTIRSATLKARSSSSSTATTVSTQPASRASRARSPSHARGLTQRALPTSAAARSSRGRSRTSSTRRSTRMTSSATASQSTSTRSRTLSSRRSSSRWSRSGRSSASTRPTSLKRRPRAWISTSAPTVSLASPESSPVVAPTSSVC